MAYLSQPGQRARVAPAPSEEVAGDRRQGQQERGQHQLDRPAGKAAAAGDEHAAAAARDLSGAGSIDATSAAPSPTRPSVWPRRPEDVHAGAGGGRWR